MLHAAAFRYKLQEYSFREYLHFGVSAAFAAISLSIIHVCCHLWLNKGSRALKRCIYLILMMVPIYAIDATICLFKAQSKIYVPEVLTLVRELYEALAVIAFVQLCMIWLGGASKVARCFHFAMQRPQHVWDVFFPSLKTRCPQMTLPMPFYPGPNAVAGMLSGILQFPFVSVILCAMNFLIWLYTINYMGDDIHAIRFMKKWTKIPKNLKLVSIGIAMYCMLLLLVQVSINAELHDRFEKLNPHRKFWAIKCVVFLTAFQQALFETVLPFLGVLASLTPPGWNDEETGSAVQNFLLCIELAFFAAFHFFAYPYSDFTDDDQFHEGDPSPWGMLQDVRSLLSEAEERRRKIRQLIRKENITDDFLEQCFTDFDIEQDGVINSHEFEWLLAVTGHSREEIAEWLEHTDKDKDGKITREEFTAVFGAIAESDVPRRCGTFSRLVSWTWAENPTCGQFQSERFPTERRTSFRRRHSDHGDGRSASKSKFGRLMSGFSDPGTPAEARNPGRLDELLLPKS